MSVEIIPNSSLHASPIVRRFYPETEVAGFSHVDCSVAFFSQVAALVRPDHHVLDYGAGRGEHLSDDPVPYRRDLATLKGRAAHVAGCDVDPIIMQNPFLDQADVIDPNQRLPYANDSFDVIVSRYVFEHIDNPAIVSSELMRVLKPGGWLCVMTPNKWGYVAIAASVIPNKMHARMLSNVQPGRKAEDVFPTRYLLNTKRAIERYFGDKADISMFYTSAEPAYYFGSSLAFRGFKWLHGLLPQKLHTCLCVYMQKRQI